MKGRILGISIVLFIGIIIAYFSISEQTIPGVFNPNQIDDKLVDAALRSKMSGHRVSNFTLTNQYGQTITEEITKDKIFVVDFFFTTCPGICKAMVKQMQRVQEANMTKEDFMIISHTVQPEIDSIPILLEYAVANGAEPKIWQFATADRSVIFDLARKSYFAAKLEEGREDEIVHTENFVLIDKERRIRGIYDGTSEAEVDNLIQDIEVIRKSYN